MSRESNDAFDAWAARKGYRPGTWNYIRTAEAWQTALALTGAQPAPAAPSDTQAVIAPPSERDPHFGGSSYDASLLRDLLAVIHRDGGHYVAQHGIEKAIADAAAQWLAAPAAQPADSNYAEMMKVWLAFDGSPQAVAAMNLHLGLMGVALDVLRELEYALTSCDVSGKGLAAKIERVEAARVRARALVAKETPHG